MNQRQELRKARRAMRSMLICVLLMLLLASGVMLWGWNHE